MKRVLKNTWRIVMKQARKHKGILATLAVVMILGMNTLVGQTKEPKSEYPETFTVIATNVGADYIVLRNFTGHFYVWGNCEDWEPGDIASAIMNDNGTADVTDDIIVTLKYSGYTE